MGKSEHGLHLINNPHKDRTEADIILIHGLNGDPRDTWTHKSKKGSVFWPEDIRFLREDTGNARIFTFGYNANIISYRSSAGFKSVGYSLLDDIHQVRVTPSEKRRRILFVCHSLGGVVVKQALLLKDEGIQDHHRFVQYCVTGILFLSTPHGGSKHVDALRRVARLIDSPIHFLDTLKKGSSELSQLSIDFENHCRVRREDENLESINIKSFIEQMKTPIIPKWKFPAIQVVDEDSARCKVPGENQRNCHGKDHRTICRFSSPEDVDYRVLRDTLIDWLKDPPSIIDPESVLHMERVSAPTAREDTYNFNASHPRNFIGRDADLEALGKCLETPVRHQMITIWGEGTIGKTSLALQFAHERQDEYRTVALLEASTDLQLRGSIDKFMDYLTRRKDEHLRNLTATLPADQSNATRFREWFEKEVKWLLIIDNIGIDGDDLVPVMKYLPKRGHGHVILICRHPKIAHLLSPKRELRVTRLGDEDAFRLLKGMAGNSAPTDFDESKKLIDTLDGVPGEIDQAGRYLHDHKISLSEYTNRLTALQGLVARTSTQYGSRVAAWRLNFERLESQHKSSMKLFHFLVMLQGSDIPAVLFERASSQVPQWDVSGSITSETLDEQFLPDPSLRKILTNKELLMKAIQPLLDYGFLSRHEDATGAHYHIHSVPQDHVKWSMMTPEERLVQHKNAIRVVSHAFPVDDILEPDFKRLRQALATQVFHCVEDCHRFLELDRIPDVAPQLLSMLMSVLGRSGNEYLLLPYAKRLSEKVNDGYFRCGIARWDAYMHDANGHSDMADTILKKAQALEEERRQNRGNHKENPRAHAALGDIIMHRAQFMTRRKLYNECDEVINSWAPCDVDAPTDIETKTYSDLKTANARNLLAQGEESKAKEILLDITHPVQERTATGEIRNIMHLNAHSFHWATVTLSEIFCKEGKFEEALKLVNPRIDEFEKSDIGHEFLFVDYLRLRCEAALRLKDFTAVEGFMNDLIKELDDSLRQAGNLRQFEQMATAKSLWARFHHMQQSWEAAIDFWKAVLSWYGIEVPQNANLSDGKHKYDIAVSILSLAICFAEAHQKESHELFDRLDSHPESLVHPAHNPDYTQWLAYLCKSRKIPEKLREKLNQNKERRSRRTKMLKF